FSTSCRVRNMRDRGASRPSIRATGRRTLWKLAAAAMKRSLACCRRPPESDARGGTLGSRQSGESTGGDRGLLRYPPLNHAAQAGLEVGSRPETEGLLSPADLQPATGLPIRLGRVPTDLAVIPD